MSTRPALSPLTLKLFGVGLAAAVLLDALFIRSTLIPGLMLLAGERNWKIPNALDRPLPQLNVEGSLVVKPEPTGAPSTDHRAGIPGDGPVTAASAVQGN